MPDEEFLPLIKSWIGSLVSIMALAMGATTSQAAPKHRRHHRIYTIHKSQHPLAPSVHTYGAENGLVGIHLFDSSEHVIGVYGSPDDLEPLTFGGTQTAGGFGGGGGFGAPGGAGAGRPMGGPGGPGRVGGGKGGGAMSGGGAGADYMTPDDLRSQFEFGDDMLQQGPGGGRFGGGRGGAAAGGFGAPRGAGGAPGMPVGGAGFPGGPGGGAGYPGGPGGAGFPGAGGKGGGAGGNVPNSGGATESVTYTRWIYNRNNNKFAFVVNRLGQVIQIEAIGLSNPKVKTLRGIGFGNQFGSIIEAYHNPDGYEIGGDNILVKYLVKDKVAFRLTRLGDKKPHQVTGIVVSAGKG